jgi:hypothetical protein
MSKSVQDIWRDITAKAWDDADFRRRLEEDTPSVLEEHGLPVQSGVDYKVVADTDTLRHLVLLRPAGDVSVAQLDGGDPLTDENAGF